MSLPEDDPQPPTSPRINGGADGPLENPHVEGVRAMEYILEEKKSDFRKVLTMFPKVFFLSLVLVYRAYLSFASLLVVL